MPTRRFWGWGYEETGPDAGQLAAVLCEAVARNAPGARQASRIQLLVDCILPGLIDLDLQLTPEALLAQAVEANVRWSMRQILETPEGLQRQTEGLLKLVGAVYEIETGRVRFLA